jgi:uncharacterized membrane protein
VSFALRTTSTAGTALALIQLAGALLLAMGRLFLFDLAGLPTDQRIITFILLGVALLTLSFAYTRLRDRWSQFARHLPATVQLHCKGRLLSPV